MHTGTKYCATRNTFQSAQCRRNSTGELKMLPAVVAVAVQWMQKLTKDVQTFSFFVGGRDAIICSSTSWHSQIFFTLCITFVNSLFTQMSVYHGSLHCKGRPQCMYWITGLLSSCTILRGDVLLLCVKHCLFALMSPWCVGCVVQHIIMYLLWAVKSWGGTTMVHWVLDFVPL